MESSMVQLRFGVLLTTLILLSMVGKVAGRVGAVRAPRSCIDDIYMYSIYSIPRGGRGSPYEFISIGHPIEDDDVNSIAASGVKLYSQQADDKKNYHLVENRRYVAYKQLLNGENFCVQFPIVSVDCSKFGFCKFGNETICSVSAFKGFKDTEPRIDPETLQCEEGEA